MIFQQNHTRIATPGAEDALFQVKRDQRRGEADPGYTEVRLLLKLKVTQADTR